ncbi:NAD-dependent epimerase/dehydratase family protein [Marinomonas balearica]|uniref:Nucleoside-diphosphate-sugar epimerase n=1 Tax=Marinomonas balearica TaxID=491947 RepID=A0A4R6MBA5_9GAMM|nr:NAD-dependent epimerase/dehydratase family protein [Marinomonas balearica]TDO97519.1 nucleoside-diphosphate-sugar epimerase [Marinomonas balearica]
MIQPRVLIAGCGDIGTSIAKNWVSAGAQVSAIRRSGTQFPDQVSGITADLTTMPSAQLPDVDLIYLIMTPQSRTETAYQSAYVETAKALVSRYARQDRIKQPKVVFVSSTSVYGENEGEWIDESSVAKAKKETSKCLLNAEKILSESMQACSARCSGIYGLGRYRLIDKIKGESEWGANSWTNRIHRDDVVSGLMILGQRLLDEGSREAPVPSHVILTDQTPVSMWEVKLWIASRIGAKVTLGAVNEFIPQTGKRIRADFLRQCGWAPKFPSYVSGYEDLLREKGETLQ